MISTKLLSVLAGMTLAAGFCVQAYAADRGASPVKGSAQPHAVIALKNLTIGYGSGGNTLNAGFNTISSATLNCPATASKGCTIVVTDMVQLVPPDGFWAICPSVNGTYINPPCPYQGLTPQGGSSYVTGNGQSNYTVSAGTSNTVNCDVYVDNTGTLANWQVTFQLYKN